MQGTIDTSSLGYILSHHLGVNWLIVLLVWLETAIAAGACLAALGRHLADVQRRGLRASLKRPGLGMVGLGVLAVALACRMALPEATFLHENFQGYLLFNDAAALTPVRTQYGLGYQAVYGLAMAVFGARFEVLFGLSVLCGALSAVLLAVVARRLLGWSLTAALMTGLMAALHPALVRFSASEILYVPGLFFVLLGVALLTDWRANRRRFSLAGGLTALLVAAQMRPDVGILAAVVLVVLLAALLLSARRSLLHRERLRELVSGPCLAMGAAALLAAFLPLHNLLWRALYEPSGSFSLLGGGLATYGRLLSNRGLLPFEGGHAVFNLAFTPLLFMAAQLAGLAILAVRRPVQAAALVLIIGLFTALWLPVQTSPFMVGRVQYGLMLMWTLPGGFCLAWCAGQVARLPLPGAKPVAVILLAGAMATGFFARDRLLAARFSPQEETAFIGASMDALPQDTLLVIMPGDEVVNSFFPAAHQSLAARGVTLLTMQDRWRDTVAAHPGPAYFYLGLGCYCFKNMQELNSQGPLRPACLEALSLAGAALRETRIPSIPFDFLALPKGSLTLGFYSLKD